jgi:hypothetical protein
MSCTCEQHGFCPVYGIPMTEHLWKICRGEVLTPEACAAYRANWARMTPGQPPKDNADCVHRGGELRREQCESCTGRIQVKIFACTVHSECTLGSLPGVLRCAGCVDYQSPASRAAGPTSE